MYALSLWIQPHEVIGLLRSHSSDCPSLDTVILIYEGHNMHEYLINVSECQIILPANLLVIVVLIMWIFEIGEAELSIYLIFWLMLVNITIAIRVTFHINIYCAFVIRIDCSILQMSVSIVIFGWFNVSILLSLIDRVILPTVLWSFLYLGFSPFS